MIGHFPWREVVDVTEFEALMLVFTFAALIVALLSAKNEKK
ncbi:putative holin-like toxin [Sporosarcina thermotolerans]